MEGWTKEAIDAVRSKKNNPAVDKKENAILHAGLNDVTYSITPVPEPRMTRADAWKKRPRVLRYFEFKDKVKRLGITIPNCNFRIIFYIPMPESWSKKKKIEMNGRPHQQKPDVDNICKALFDAIYESDCMIWDCRMTKRWGTEGKIRIIKYART